MIMTTVTSEYSPRHVGTAGFQPPMAVPPISRALLRLFTGYSESYLGRHFAAVHLSGERPNFQSVPGPIVVYLNHASWWDPLVCLLLANRLTVDRDNYAPIDTKSLAQFRFFKRLGFFGVEKDSRRGVIQFLEKSAAILGDARSVLWVTPQGDFVDPRVRPTLLKSGIGQLPLINPDLRFFPLALDYYFSGTRLPSVAVRFGEPLGVSDFPFFDRRDWTPKLAAALESAQDALAEEVISKRISTCETILAGRNGMGGIYGFWQSIRGRKC